MNLQQLNGNGRSLGAFIGTAVIALALTGGSWWLIELLNGLLAMRKRNSEDQCGRPRSDYGITVRLAMLAWLVCNGHWSWMRKSGAGWHILTNSGLGFRNNFNYPKWVAASKNLTAGCFVSTFAKKDIKELRELYLISPFDVSGGGWFDEMADKTSGTNGSV